MPPVAHSSFTVEPFKLNLRGLHFSGDDLTGKRSFKDFLTKFENCAASITDDSYPIAIQMLKEQYMDKEEKRANNSEYPRLST